MSNSENFVISDRLLHHRMIRLTLALFTAYMAVTLPLPLLTKFVSQQLNFNDSWAGLSVGMSFITTFLSRIFAGRFADIRGPTRCFFYGILFYTIANVVCLIATLLTIQTQLAYGLLLVGRALLGVGESCVNVGMISWGLSQSGAQRSGLVMIWVGAGMYGAYTIGAPLGIWLDFHFGFTVVLLISAIMPLIGALAVIGIPKAHSLGQSKPQFNFTIWRQVLAPGTIIAAQGIGFAVLGAFATLYFLNHHWPYAGFALMLFGIGFILTRFIGIHWIERYGARKVAGFSLALEAIGQSLLWLAINPTMALVGALLTGCGCSMIFPAMGVEVIRRITHSARSTGIASFAVFQDIAYGFSAPLVGLVTAQLGYQSAFMIGTFASIIGLVILFNMHQSSLS